VRASVIHTTSVGAFAASFGQAGYAAAKLGIVGLSAVAALEGAKFGVRSNAVAPSGRTRMALEGMAGASDLMAPPPAGQFDPWDPENVSPIVAWLAEDECPASGQIFHVLGGVIRVVSMPHIASEIRADRRWRPDELGRALGPRLITHPTIESYLEP
jgi:NAD(P)-dependent dehydrogenase (short-subunit alcohol dehydrogenase family)